MRIKDTGFSLTPPADFYREKRSRAEEPQKAGEAAGASFSGALRRTEKAAAGRTDKIEISGRQAEESDLSPEKIGAGIRRKLSENTDPARLESLRRRVASGEYSIDADELARVLLTGV